MRADQSRRRICASPAPTDTTQMQGLSRLVVVFSALGSCVAMEQMLTDPEKTNGALKFSLKTGEEG